MISSASQASLARLQARHWGLVVVATVAASTFGSRAVGGVLLGGCALGLSVFLYAAMLGAIVRRQRPRLAIAMLSVKLAALLGLGWLTFASGGDMRPDPVAFAVGVTCFPAAAIWEAVGTRRTGKR